MNISKISSLVPKSLGMGLDKLLLREAGLIPGNSIRAGSGNRTIRK